MLELNKKLSINLNNQDSIKVNQIVVSDKFKHIDDGSKYFIGYRQDDIVKPLCIILPQMSGYIKYFENRGKNMSFMIKNNDVLDRYNEIWDSIKGKLNIKFHGMPVYYEKYIKTKVKEFDCVIKTNTLCDKEPKGNKRYTCIACITIHFVMRMEKKNYPQVYLEECKYRMKKTRMTKFVETKLKSDSEVELKSDTELEAKLKSDSGSDSE